MIVGLDAIAQASATRMVDCLVEGTLMAAFAALISRVIRRQDAGTKFAVWFAALMAIAALPLAWPSAGGMAGGPEITLPASWALYLFAAWAALAGGALLRVGAGLRHVHSLRKNCEAVELGSLDAKLRETLEEFQVRRVTLCISDEVDVPTAIGLMRPAIVIPRWLMPELTAPQLHQILLHELAHLRRWDDWTNLAQKIVKALLFFHPAVWWIEKKISLEREMACDDAVLEETSSPRAYAECLAHLAEKTLMQRSIALAQAALGRIRQTSQRVARILDANRASGRHAWKIAVPALAGFAVICGIGISRAPRLVAFDESGPNRASLPVMVALAGDQVERRGVPVTALSWHEDASANKNRSAAIAQAKPLKARTKAKRVQSDPSVVADAGAGSGAPSMARAAVRPAMLSLDAVVASEAVVVVVGERSVSGSEAPIYEIQVFRLTVFHPVADPAGNKIPRKVT